MAVAVLLGAVRDAGRVEMRVIFSIALLILIALSMTVLAQRPEDMTRKLWDTAFSDSSKKPTNRRRVYRNATPNVPVNDVAPETVVGVTLWRLRRPTQIGRAHV